MMNEIIVYGPDNREFRFPAGTPPDVIERELMRVYSQGPGRPTSPVTAPSPAPSQPYGRDVRGMGEAMLRGAVHGVTMGWSDELLAGLQSMLGSRSYEEVLAEERARLDELRRQLPVAFGAGQIGGTLVTAPLIPPPLRAGMGLGTQIARGAAQGLLAGAITGAGEAERDTFGSAVSGGVGGAAAGAVVPPALAVTRRAGSFLLDALPSLRDVLSRVGLAATPERRAAEAILRDVYRDQTTPAVMQQRLQEFSGKPVVAADLAGGNVRELADVAAAAPGSPKTVYESLRQRYVEQAERTANDIISAVGNDPNKYRTLAELIKQQQIAAQPLYAKLMAETANTPVTDETILSLLQRPDGRSAYRLARRIAANEGLELPQIMDDKGNIVSYPNLQVLDYVKRALDDRIFERTVRGSASTALVRSMKEIRKALIDRLDAIFPDYAKARAAWAGPERIKELITEGASMVKPGTSADPREVVKRLMELPNDQERAWFRYGMQDELLRQLRNTKGGKDVVKEILENPTRRRYMQIAMGTEAYEKFLNTFRAEQAMQQTYERVATNSRTAQRMAKAQDITDSEITTAFTPWNIPAIASRTLKRRAVAGTAPTVTDLLLQRPPAETLKILSDYEEEMVRRGMRRLRIPAATSSTIGGLLAW